MASVLSSLGFKTGIRAIYNVLDNPSFVSEPWAVYPAKHKSTGRIVSVFIFDKTKFELQVQRLCSTSSNASSPKRITKECYELIKHEVNQLSKLKHPQILTIIEVLEETKTKFLFVSESVSDNLLTVNSKNLDSLSIQKGLLQVAKGLQFLHSHGNIIHLNIQPSSIFINNQGDWKLAGFRFLQNLNELSPQDRDNFYIMNTSTVVPFANLNLNFTAPELIVDAQTKLDFANDIWSFGMLIFYVYNFPDSLINSFDPSSITDYKQEFRKFEQKFYNHASKPAELKYILKNVPDKLYPLFPQLLSRYPYDRLTLNQFIDSDFFDGSIIKAMWFIDEFSTKSIHEKLMFLKGLLEFDKETQTDLLSQFPLAFKSLKLLPLLIGVIINELTVLDESATIDPNVDELISYSLEIILAISKNISALTFQDRVFGILFKDNSSFTEKVYDAIFKDETKSTKKNATTKIFTKLINASVKTRLTIVNNLDVLQEKSNEKQFVGFIKHILDLVFTLGSNEQDQKHVQITLQEKFLETLPKFVTMFEFPYMKNTMFPLLCRIFLSTLVYSTKLKIMDTFEKFCDLRVIDKIIIDEQLLPITQNIKERDREMISKLVPFLAKVVTSEHINMDMKTAVESILPQCMVFAFGCNDCTQKEFKAYMSTINGVQEKLVEKKLSQLPEHENFAARSHGSGSATAATTAANFDTLLQLQRLKEPEKEVQGPKSQAMQPTRKPASIKSMGSSHNKSTTNSNSNSNSISNGNNNSVMKPRRPLQSRVSASSSSSSSFSATANTTATTATNTNTANKNYSSSGGSNINGALNTMKFGAIDEKSNSKNDRLLNSLKSTYERQKYEDNDDDFDDFQLSSGANVGGSINWSSESNKMKTLPVTPRLNNESFRTNNSVQTKFAMDVSTSQPAKVTYPPGFNTNVVLSPNASSTKSQLTSFFPQQLPTKTNYTGNTGNTGNTSSINSDLLDLL